MKCGIELWNRNKNSYIGHSHKRIRPHLHIFACLQFLILNSQSMFNRNCYQEPGWLFQIRIVNMQKCVSAVVDICGVWPIHKFFMRFHSSVTFVIPLLIMLKFLVRYSSSII